MCVLMWTALLFYVRGIGCDGAAQKQHCETGSYCISLSKGATTAEAGLCAVIPCSFTADAQFNVTQLLWYKCGSESPTRCDKPDRLVFNSSNRSAVVQSEFRGRVSLLEPDLSLNKCSIIINDLRESDSGSFQLRLSGYNNRKATGFTFTSPATLTVTGLSQTPTVTVPPLTAGQQNTLTCTAPGLCSGSAPTFTWRWRKPGGNHSHITGNITAVDTENVSAVAQRHSSSLTFDLSAEHHGTEVTCKVSFTGDVETEETVTLNVSYVKKPKISGNPTVKAGDTLHLTCDVDSFPPSYVTWTKYGSDGLLEESQTGSVSVIIYNTTADTSGQFVCTAQHPVRTVAAQVTVTYVVTNVLLNVKWLQVAFGFIIGILFSAAVVCLARRCHRTNPKNTVNRLETMEMQTVLEADAGHNDETPCREVNYSVIDFSMLKRKDPTKAKETAESTEYSEIKTRAVERRHGEGKEGETLEGNEEQEAAVLEQREKEQCIVGKEEENEEMALYSNVHKAKQQA